MPDRVASSSGTGHDAAALLPCTCDALEPYCPRHSPLPGEPAAARVTVAVPAHVYDLVMNRVVVGTYDTRTGLRSEPSTSRSAPMPDPPVAAPDPGEALMQEFYKLLAERQQDKERIERLETALNEARPYVEWMAAGPRDAADDASTAKAVLAQVDAALAVEEDAE